MNTRDPFIDIARFYDPIMHAVNYDRWLFISMLLADLVPKKKFAHLDVGCGTGILVKRLLQHGWNSVGIDLSFAMLKAGTRGGILPATAVANMDALPFTNRFDLVTSVFDSINFVLDPDHLTKAICEMGDALTRDGIFYFDIITERMVTEYFENQEWTENNGRFATTWKGSYDRTTRIAETLIRVNNGPATTVRERAHTIEEIEAGLSAAGLELLGAFDAETWKAPGRKTVRVDFIAVKHVSRSLRKQFKAITARVRDQLAG